MLNLIKSEPVAFGGLVTVLISLATSFGLHLTPEQVSAITAFVAALTAFIVRGKVSPNATGSGSQEGAVSVSFGVGLVLLVILAVLILSGHISFNFGTH